MSHELTLDEAAERATQAEIVCRLLEHYPCAMESSDISAIATLLRRLTGNVAAWLIEEQAHREGKA
ncbi:hypothetical protein GTU79_08815 [Sodalis ligni]|uniref:hypothetical protein n=1 Tax=Sodalis ligni TaxID=2697027 RepID=UPI00193F3D23|nr:hypothetical protein [Sodalis ligni]QWA12775.1 hypothetical protein GTU79_08815 [Sodalis ligni]